MSATPDHCLHLTADIVRAIHEEAIADFGGSEGKGFRVFFYGEGFESRYVYLEGKLIKSERIVDEPISNTASQ